MNVPFNTKSVSSAPNATEAGGRSPARSYSWLEWIAGAGALALAMLAMLLFMMNTIAERVDALIEQQNTAALKLSDSLHYFNEQHNNSQDNPQAPSDDIRPIEAYHVANPVPIPPGLFSDLVEFSRNTVIVMLEVHRLRGLEFTGTLGLAGDSPSKEGEPSWSQKMLTRLSPRDGATTKFDHTGVNPRTTANNIVEAGNYQIELYQSLRDFSQEQCTAYKDTGGAISIFLLPLLYALLGAGLCDLRCRLTRVSSTAGRLPSLASARYTTAMIAGVVIGIFTSFLPTSISLPPLFVAFLLGYSVETFTARLDALIDKLRMPDGAT